MRRTLDVDTVGAARVQSELGLKRVAKRSRSVCTRERAKRASLRIRVRSRRDVGGESRGVDDDGNEITVNHDELRLVSSSTPCDLPPVH